MRKDKVQSKGGRRFTVSLLALSLILPISQAAKADAAKPSLVPSIEMPSLDERVALMAKSRQLAEDGHSTRAVGTLFLLGSAVLTGFAINAYVHASASGCPSESVTCLTYVPHPNYARQAKILTIVDVPVFLLGALIYSSGDSMIDESDAIKRRLAE